MASRHFPLPTISPRTISSSHSPRAFTLIEMMVVIAVLSLLAALVTPNLVAVKRSQDARDLDAAILRLPAEARQEALKAKAPVIVTVDGDALVLQKTNGDDDPTEIKRVPLTGGVTVDSTRRDGESVDTASFEWMVYPDGTSDSARIELSENGATRALILPERGAARWAAPDEPADEETRWQAGEVTLRG